MKFLLLFAVFLYASPLAAQPEITVDLTPSKDNSLFEELPSNSAGLGFLYSGEIRTGGSRRALIAFDLSSIPAGAIITNATVTVDVNRARDSSARDYTLHRLTSDWGEGTSNPGGQGGQGTAAIAPDATWTQAMSDAVTPTAWGTPGGDFVAAQSALLSIRNNGDYTFSAPGLLSDVSDWYDGSEQNFGWILIGDESVNGSARRFGSKDSGTPPVLSVTYRFCASAADCDDGNACTVGSCVNNQCEYVNEPVGTNCGDPSSSECNQPDTCDANGVCLDNFATDGTTCGAAPGECDLADTCQAGVCEDEGFALAGTGCGDSNDTECDNPDICDGFGACSSNFELTGAACGDSTDSECDNPDSCDGAGSCAPNMELAGVACGDATTTECDLADSCDGAGLCAINHVALGANCGPPATECQPQDTCDSGLCIDAGLSAVGTPCGDPSSNECNQPDSCNAIGLCQANASPDGAGCGPAGTICSPQDVCQAGFCIESPLAPNGTPCDGNIFCLAGDACINGLCAEGANDACGADEKCDENGALCFLACGDGVLDADEICDDGMLNSDTQPGACRTNCMPASCGDGVVDAGEGCDDGAANADTPGANCRLDCSLASCGDGIVDPAEECDDGLQNADEPNVCRTTCVLPSCGDGLLDDGEVCDEGMMNSDVAIDACRTSCQPASCGDGVIDTGEACDDSGASDTCSSECQTIEPAVDMGGMADVGTPDMGGEVDMGTTAPPSSGGDEGGCGCATSKADASPILFLFALLMFRRRRESH